MLKQTLVILPLLSVTSFAASAVTSVETTIEYEAKSICYNVAKALNEDWHNCDSKGPMLDKQGTTEYVFMTKNGERACRVWTTSKGQQKGFLSPAPIDADECPLGTFFNVAPVSKDEHQIEITFGGN
ncbi:hypothetical protein TUM4261_41010 [Shewanella sp. c952]|uniref:hypothetical protein n=1 Tax=Shewanella sp. c952 TaxID=2815913 RepID=UPI001BB9EF35|nr:hypothetical protein [Shewanella sp. c952]GIU19240.1 hypothetical protein TUM4261_41010 [Shewanella sp. c952]